MWAQLHFAQELKPNKADGKYATMGGIQVRRQKIFVRPLRNMGGGGVSRSGETRSRKYVPPLEATIYRVGGTVHNESGNESGDGRGESGGDAS